MRALAVVADTQAAATGNRPLPTQVGIQRIEIAGASADSLVQHSSHSIRTWHLLVEVKILGLQPELGEQFLYRNTLPRCANQACPL